MSPWHTLVCVRACVPVDAFVSLCDASLSIATSWCKPGVLLPRYNVVLGPGSVHGRYERDEQNSLAEELLTTESRVCYIVHEGVSIHVALCGRGCVFDCVLDAIVFCRSVFLCVTRLLLCEGGIVCI